MGYGQRNARFYCEVDSARTNREKILGSAQSGMCITVAGEYGSLTIRVWAGNDKPSPSQRKGDHRNDKFEILFRPWRRSGKRGSVALMSGRLNFDDHSDGNLQMRVDKELLEAITLLRAKEIMLEEVTGNKD